MTHTARGLRGDYKAVHGDLTGAAYLRQQDEKADREKAIQSTTNAMRDGTPLAIIPIPGGRAFAIPKQIVAYLQADNK